MHPVLFFPYSCSLNESVKSADKNRFPLQHLTLKRGPTKHHHRTPGNDSIYTIYNCLHGSLLSQWNINSYDVISFQTTAWRWIFATLALIRTFHSQLGRTHSAELPIFRIEESTFRTFRRRIWLVERIPSKLGCVCMKKTQRCMGDS